MNKIEEVPALKIDQSLQMFSFPRVSTNVKNGIGERKFNLQDRFSIESALNIRLYEHQKSIWENYLWKSQKVYKSYLIVWTIRKLSSIPKIKLVR